MSYVARLTEFAAYSFGKPQKQHSVTGFSVLFTSMATDISMRQTPLSYIR